jgi:hypothetical protein
MHKVTETHGTTLLKVPLSRLHLFIGLQRGS